ncbi:hypothetical protein D3C76_01490 [compost metagenome]
MNETLRAFSKELKEMLELDSSKRLKATDWQNVYTVSFSKGGTFSLNDNYPSLDRIKWDLHHLYRFTDIRTLYIENVADYLLLELGGKDAFDFRFWFDKFKHLNGLNLKLGSFENSRTAHCYKVKLKEQTCWILHCNGFNEYSVEIWTEDSRYKCFYFGNNKKVSRAWFMNSLEYLLNNRELPNDMWFENLKAKDIDKSFRERSAIISKAENKPEATEKLY